MVRVIIKWIESASMEVDYVQITHIRCRGEHR